MGSTNGTYLNGKRIPAGIATPLAPGALITFGKNGPTWTLIATDPPRAFAQCLDEHQVLVSETGLLSLVDSRAPNFIVYREGSGWVLEQGYAVAPVEDRETVHVEGRTWRLHLPQPLPGTQEQICPTLERIVMQFHVRLDEEAVQLRVRFAERIWDLKSRAHHYLLLTLARARMTDAADPELPVTAQGWLDQANLCRMLKLDENALHQQIYRARRQLASEGIEGAAGLIERRPERQLRLGILPGSVEVNRG